MITKWIRHPKESWDWWRINCLFKDIREGIDELEAKKAAYESEGVYFAKFGEKD